MKRILIVDDSLVIREQVSKVLTEAGYQVVEAADGLMALEELRAAHFDLMLCDVNMPRLDGLGLLERVKADAINEGLRILMLTAEGHPAEVARARAAGAKGWLVKPVRPDLLMMAVHKLAPPQ